MDTKSLLTLENHVRQKTNDKQELKPAVEKLASLPKALGSVTDIIGDNGFFSKDNAETCIANNMVPCIAPDLEQHNKSPFDRFCEPPPLLDTADAVTQMKHRLETAAGKAMYAIRKSTIEPVFGIIKAIMEFDRFILRGFEAVKGGWNLVCMVWNIKRPHALAK